MSKFHINKHGVPAPCQAKKGNCPLGGDSGNENHFNTKEEAEQASYEMHSSKFGIIDGIEDIKGIQDNLKSYAIDDEDREEIESGKDRAWGLDSNGKTVPMDSGSEGLKEVGSYKKSKAISDRITEENYSSEKGLQTPVRSGTMSIEEEEEYYLSKSPMETGMTEGPHKVEPSQMDGHINNYLDGDYTEKIKSARSRLSNSFEDKAQVLILQEKSEPKGLLSRFSRGKVEKGIMYEKIRLPKEDGTYGSEMYKMHYLDEEGVKIKTKEFIEKGENTPSRNPDTWIF